MATLDVSEVLLDPLFQEFGLIATRSIQSVTIGGIGQVATSDLVFNGVVTQATGESLKRISEGQILSGAITIHTKFILTNGRGNNDADIVTWRGRKYIVNDVQDYSHFGEGFIGAICTLLAFDGVTQ